MLALPTCLLPRLAPCRHPALPALFSSRFNWERTSNRIDHAIEDKLSKTIAKSTKKNLAKNARKLLRQCRNTVDQRAKLSRSKSKMRNLRFLQPFKLCGELGNYARSAHPAILGEVLLVATQKVQPESLGSEPLSEQTDARVTASLSKDLQKHIDMVKAGTAEKSPLAQLVAADMAFMEEDAESFEHDADEEDDDSDSDSAGSYDSEGSSVSASDTDTDTDEDDEAEGSGDDDREASSDADDTDEADEADEHAEDAEHALVAQPTDLLYALQLRFCDLLDLDYDRPYVWSCSVIDFIWQRPALKEIFEAALAATLSADAGCNDAPAPDDSHNDAPQATITAATILDHLAALADKDASEADEGDNTVLAKLVRLERSLCEQLQIASFETLQLGSFVAFLQNNAADFSVGLGQYLHEAFSAAPPQNAAALSLDEQTEFLRGIYAAGCRFGLDVTLSDAQAALVTHFASRSAACAALSQKQWTMLTRAWSREGRPEGDAAGTLPMLARLLVCKNEDTLTLALPSQETPTPASAAATPLSVAECCRVLSLTPPLKDVGAVLQWETSLAPYFGPLGQFLRDHARLLADGGQFVCVSLGRWVRLPSSAGSVKNLIALREKEGRLPQPALLGQQLAAAVLFEMLAAGHLTALAVSTLQQDVATFYALAQQQQGAADEASSIRLAWRAYALLPPPLHGKEAFDVLLTPALRSSPGWDSRLPEVFAAASDWVLFRKTAQLLGNAGWQSQPLPAALAFANDGGSEAGAHLPGPPSTSDKQGRRERNANDAGPKAGAPRAGEPKAAPSPTLARNDDGDGRHDTAAPQAESVLRENASSSDASIMDLDALADVGAEATGLSEKECQNILATIHRKFGQNLDATIDAAHLLPLQELRAYAARTTKYLATELYAAQVHFLMELIQNADDCTYPPDAAPRFEITLTRSSIELQTNEVPRRAVCFGSVKPPCSKRLSLSLNLPRTLTLPPFPTLFPPDATQVGFTPKNVLALCSMGESTKKRSELSAIGNKGIGFKSVFKLSPCPEVHSRNFHFRFDAQSGEGLAFVLPLWTEAPAGWDASGGTLIRLPLYHDDNAADTDTAAAAQEVDRLAQGRQQEANDFRRGLLRDVHAKLLLFLNRLRWMHVHDEISGLLRVLLRRDLGDGLVRLEEVEGAQAELAAEMQAMPSSAAALATSATKGVVTASTWLCTSDIFEAPSEEGPRLTTVTIAVPWPDLDVADTAAAATLPVQDVFAYLPLRSYGFRFILQADWDIPAARESIDHTSSWYVSRWEGGKRGRERTKSETRRGLDTSSTRASCARHCSLPQEPQPSEENSPFVPVRCQAGSRILQAL